MRQVPVQSIGRNQVNMEFLQVSFVFSSFSNMSNLHRRDRLRKHMTQPRINAGCVKDITQKCNVLRKRRRLSLQHRVHGWSAPGGHEKTKTTSLRLRITKQILVFQAQNVAKRGIIYFHNISGLLGIYKRCLLNKIGIYESTLR